MAVTITSSDIPTDPLAELTDEELVEIGIILNMYRHFDLSVYKDKCMKRRISIRMRSMRCQNGAEYCNLLRQSPQELDLLQKSLTIHVSQFYRNPSMFEKLRDRVFPELFKTCSLNGTGTLRIWSLGCAGGEEPYSLAILLREHFSRELRNTSTQIHGTDIDAQTLNQARRGEFIEERLKDVSDEQRKRYFRMEGGRYRLVPEISSMVTFHQADISNTTEYIHSDLVLCRNTLIYFTRPDQEKILLGVADILPSGGILVLGKSETLVGSSRTKFESICPVERIYRRL